MKKHPCHHKNIASLKRAEGQVRGVIRMVEEGKYCVDIINQIHAAMAALARIEDNILETHLEACVTNSIRGGSSKDRAQKLNEILKLIQKSRKL